MKPHKLWVAMLLLANMCLAQQKDSKSASTNPHPSLGFNKLKDVSPIMDADAFLEEQELKKKLPDNRFVGDKRAFHEAALMREFLDRFRESKECEGIGFYLKTDKLPDFTIQITVNNHDKSDAEQEWIWILSDRKAKELGGMGNQSSSKLTARDVCTTVWEDIDPNHYKNREEPSSSSPAVGCRRSRSET